MVDGHELCDPRAVVVEFGARAALLNNRNPETEGCNFQRDRFENAYRPSSRPPLASGLPLPAQCAVRCSMWVREGPVDSAAGF
jgi:hypothetical protein